MYAGEPTLVIIVRSETLLIAAPKSAILMSVPSLCRMLPGLRSRCVRPSVVREGERAHALEDDLGHLARLEQRLGHAELLERAALHVLHHDVAVLVLHHRVEDLHDVRVVELARERRLVEEHAAVEGPVLAVLQRLGEGDLDRHADAWRTGPRRDRPWPWRRGQAHGRSDTCRSTCLGAHRPDYSGRGAGAGPGPRGTMPETGVRPRFRPRFPRRGP